MKNHDDDSDQVRREPVKRPSQVDYLWDQIWGELCCTLCGASFGNGSEYVNNYRADSDPPYVVDYDVERAVQRHLCKKKKLNYDFNSNKTIVEQMHEQNSVPLLPVKKSAAKKKAYAITGADRPGEGGTLTEYYQQEERRFPFQNLWK